ncbi:MAG: gamma-glutamyltransferase [Planctomycetes bacterium]|nr:gamma-glutamyltransferase [Planctomycetota bacterium]
MHPMKSMPRFLLLALSAALLFACQGPTRDLSRSTGARALATADIPTGIGGAAVTSEANATFAATSMLERGGNAVDAAIAASFALAVTYPAAGNIGGGGFFMYWAPRGGDLVFVFSRGAAAAGEHHIFFGGGGSPP